MFSNRTRWQLALNRLSQKLELLRRENIPLLDLTQSNPTSAEFAFPKQILKSLEQPANAIYQPDPKGLLTARTAIVRYYAEKGMEVEPEQVIVTASTSEAYSWLFRLLLDPGDFLLIPKPGYPLLDYLSDISDVKLAGYPLVYEGKWRLDQEALDRQEVKNAKAIVTVHPNNPTGNFVKRKERDFLNRFAGRNNLAIISDEVFGDYGFGEDAIRAGSLAGNQDVLTFTLSGISKILALPQMKLGWIVVNGPAEICRQALERLELIADTFLSVSAPVQNALGSWLLYANAIQNEIRKRLGENLEILKRSIHGRSAIELLTVEGGWTVVLRIPRIHSEEEWALEFLEKDHVWVQPGYFYDFPSEAYIVISLLTPTSVFEEGVGKILARIGQSL